MMISRWNVFKEWTEPHEVLHEQWRTESSTGYLIMLNNFHHGLYIPAVCHASFVSQVPKIHFDTLMHLCSYPLQQASSLLSPLSPWDTFWEMRHLLIWCTKIDVQVTSMGTEERGEGGGPNREMRRAQRRGKQRKYKEMEKFGDMVKTVTFSWLHLDWRKSITSTNCQPPVVYKQNPAT